jgi:predicted glycosyltransferase
MINKKRFLFYLEHPAKYHFHRIQINTLKSNGHQVDIVINTKDILEELVIKEGWDYTNLFPNTRKIKGLHVYLAAFISLFKTIFKLYKYTYGKKYDLFFGDALVYIGRLKGVPSFYPTDDVLAAVPEQRVFFIPANFIIAPEITDIGKFKRKKIAYKGYKALAHLHPNHFKPDRNKLIDQFKNSKRFFIIRCTGFGATHDINKRGVDDDILNAIIKILEPLGDILISSERELPNELRKYQTPINKNDVSHYIAFSDLFIGDSTTMCTESAVLGVPTVEFDEYFYEIEQMLELEKKYDLISCFRTNETEKCLMKISELVNNSNAKAEQLKKAEKFFYDMIDVSSFITWILDEYPNSYEEFKKNPNIQYRFK